MNVIVIDSGVFKEHEIFHGINIDTYQYCDGTLYDGETDPFGHGTAVTGIISTACRDIDMHITVIQIKDIQDGIEESELIGVLSYINEHMDCDIINLSLGITVCEEYDRLYEVCQQLAKRGVIIVSAFDNDGAISYPAAFDNVIGVTSGEGCNKVNQFVYVGSKVVNLGAKGGIQRVPWNYPRYIMIGGNSFACAHAAAQIVRFWDSGIRSKNEVLQEFQKIAVKSYDVPGETEEEKKLFEIHKAALFPFNKEMHTLVRYYKMLSFEITDIYDSRYSARVGALTTRLMNDDTVKLCKVQDIKNINWDAFDTLILGHLEELSGLVHQSDLKETLVKQALAHGKKIYAFDDLSDLIEKSENVYYPVVDRSLLSPNYYGKLYKVSKPVLGVFGTSSQQGKFTLQMKLRQLLLEKGYQIGQIGTEPSALLYGMDYVYPMGYNSSVYLKEYEVIRYLNGAINNLCNRENDLIMVGSQAGTITYDTGNLEFYNLWQYQFLLGTQPDAVILVVNPFDELNHIQRTIQFIESSVDCRVVALVVFPMTLKEKMMGLYGGKTALTDDNFMLLKNMLQDKLQLPVYCLGKNADMEELLQVVIDYFSGE